VTEEDKNAAAREAYDRNASVHDGRALRRHPAAQERRMPHALVGAELPVARAEDVHVGRVGLDQDDPDPRTVNLRGRAGDG
jgi:hypothetical protein